MLTTEFDYNSVPRGFAHCLNEQCPQSADCLRRQAALHITANCQFIKIVSPSYTPAADEKCPYYKSDKPIRFAFGVRHLYDDLPHKVAMDIKQTILYHYGRSGYYRYYRKECLFNLQDQAYIRQVFRKHGVTSEPVYDGFVNGYIWW